MKRSRFAGAVPSAHPAALSIKGTGRLAVCPLVLFLREASCESCKMKGGFSWKNKDSVCQRENWCFWP